MGEHSYDVTNPNDRIKTVHAPPRKCSKIICFLTFILLILVGVIIYIQFSIESCYSKQNNESLFDIFDKEPITTRAISTEDLRTVESISKVPIRKMNDDLEKNTCKSIECLHTAAQVLSSMDLTMSPCENFYEYACGNMDSQEEEVPDIFAPYLYRYARTPNFLKKFRTFYESCVIYEDRFDYEKRLDTTKALLNQVGSFYLPGQKKKDLNTTQVIASLILYGAMPLFDITIDIDLENTYIMKLLMPDQTSLELEYWSPLSETKRKCLRQSADATHEKSLNMTLMYNIFLLCQKNYGDYVDSISTAIWELKILSNLTEDAVYKRLFDIRTFMEFEILSKFDQIPLPPNLQEQTIKRQYEEIKIGQLEKEFPIIEWQYLFRMISNKSISSDTKIQMYNRDYFEDVLQHISTLPREKLNDVFLAILASSLYVNMVLPSHRDSRVTYCQERSKELMPDIINYLYKLVIKKEELEKQNADIKIIYDILKDRFRDSLQNRSWLDDSEKDSILKKLNKIQLVMFENDDIQSESAYLEEAYKDIELLKDNYQTNHFNLIEFRKRRLLSLYGKKVSQKDMYRNFVDATQEEPVYFYANDIVCIPYGLVRKSADNLPAYMVLAQVGFPIAKVIGRAFDRIGIGYGINLKEKSSRTYNYFADQTRDMIASTNPITYGKKHLYFNLNNDLSESERIADNTAMRLMTDSFITFANQPMLPWISHDFSREEVFFVFLTQGLCRKIGITELMVEAFESPNLPAQFRVENMMSNSLEFLKIFSCQPGSGMNLLKNHFQFPYLEKASKNLRKYNSSSFQQ